MQSQSKGVRFTYFVGKDLNFVPRVFTSTTCKLKFCFNLFVYFLSLSFYSPNNDCFDLTSYTRDCTPVVTRRMEEQRDEVETW